MTHAKVLAKYFLAEGVLSKQEIFLGSLDDSPAEMLRRLPKPLTDEEVELEQQQEQKQANEQPDKNALRIAFRYNDLPLVNSEQATAKIGHHFNLMQHMDSMMLYYAQTTVWDDSYKEYEVFKQDDNISNSSNSLEREQQPPNAGSAADVSNASTETECDSTASSTTTTTNNTNANANANNINNNINNNNNNNNATDSTTANNATISSSTTATSATGTGTGTATAATTSATSPATQPASSSSGQAASFFYNPRYDRLLNDLQQLLRDESFVLGTNTQQKNLCRVCLTSLGSPLWYDDHFAADLLKFLTVLRASVRSCTAVCFITMPMHLIAKYVRKRGRVLLL